MNAPLRLDQSLWVPIIEGMQARWREAQDYCNSFEKAYGWTDDRTQRAQERATFRYNEMRAVERAFDAARREAA